MTCDNGVTFQSKLWKDINDNLGTIVSYTPIYSSASLGTLERQHLDLKSSLKACLLAMGTEHQDKWMRKLPYVLLARRTAYHAELGTTPATVVYGEDPLLPGDIRPPMGSGESLEQLKAKVQELPNRPPAQTNLRKEPKIYMPPSTESATHVYTKVPKKTPLGPRYNGPYPIKERRGKSCLVIRTAFYANGQERLELRHWNTCYPANPTDAEVPDAVKKPLGRRPLNPLAKPFEKPS